MRAFRPSRFGGIDPRDILMQMDVKEKRVSLYQRRAQKGLPVFDGPGEPGPWPKVRGGHDTDRQETGYRVVWEYVATGQVVVGQYTFPSGEVARAIARAMDVLWPEIRHRAVPARDLAPSRADGGDREGVVAACARHGGD